MTTVGGFNLDGEEPSPISGAMVVMESLFALYIQVVLG